MRTADSMTAQLLKETHDPQLPWLFTDVTYPPVRQSTALGAPTPVPKAADSCMAAATVSALSAAISSGVTISPRKPRLCSADICVRKFLLGLPGHAVGLDRRVDLTYRRFALCHVSPHRGCGLPSSLASRRHRSATAASRGFAKVMVGRGEPKLAIVAASNDQPTDADLIPVGEGHPASVSGLVIRKHIAQTSKEPGVIANRTIIPTLISLAGRLAEGGVG